MKTLLSLALLASLVSFATADVPQPALNKAIRTIDGNDASGVVPPMAITGRGFIDGQGRVSMYVSPSTPLEWRIPGLLPDNGFTLRWRFTEPTGNGIVTWPDVVAVDTTVVLTPFVDDFTLSPPLNGGNAGANNAFTGIVNSTLVPFGTMTDGTASVKTKALMDDTPAGEWSAIGGGTADPTPTNSTAVVRVGTNSLKIPFTAPAVAGDGVKFTAFSGEDWEAQESVGMWVYSSVALTAGDVVLKTVDSTGDVSFNMPAVATANKWTWVEFNIAALAGGTGDAVTNVKIALSTAGAALGAFDLYIDGAYKWDATEELALGVDLVDSPGAVRKVLTFQKAASGEVDATAIVPTAIAEGTDYFVHYESGNDFLVTITDQSLRSGFALVMHK